MAAASNNELLMCELNIELLDKEIDNECDEFIKCSLVFGCSIGIRRNNPEEGMRLVGTNELEEFPILALQIFINLGKLLNSFIGAKKSWSPIIFHKKVVVMLLCKFNKFLLGGK